MASQEIFDDVEATLKGTDLTGDPVKIQSSITTCKAEHGVTLEATKTGTIKVRGTLAGITAIHTALHSDENESSSDVKTMHVSVPRGDQYEQILVDFLKKKAFGCQEDKTSISRKNINSDDAEICMGLIEQRKEIDSLLRKSNSRMQLKGISKSKMIVRFEVLEGGVSKKDEITKLCKQSIRDKHILTRPEVSNIKDVSALANQIMDAVVSPQFCLITQDEADKNKWSITVVTKHHDKKTNEDNESKVNKIINQHKIKKPRSIMETLYKLCDRDFREIGKRAEIKESGVYTGLQENGVRGQPTSNSSVSEDSQGPMTLEFDDENVIEYLQKEIQLKYGAELVFDKGGSGKHLIKPMITNMEKANDEFARFLQDSAQNTRSEVIDVKAMNKHKQISAVQFQEIKKATEDMQCVCKRQKDGQIVLILPDERIDEMTQVIRDVLGLSRKFLPRIPSNPGIVSQGAAAPLQSMRDSNGIPRTVYGLNGVKVYAWVANITQLHVGAVVNAANERLDHGGGVALAISKAAGRDLVRECKDYIRHSGPLPVSCVKSTTAGNMPSKYVIHTVGPQWTKRSKKEEVQAKLKVTFLSCLKEAHKMRLKSIALPAISSGIYGVPKEVVANMAIEAIMLYVESFDTPSVTSIHLVDIQPDTVLCFQDALRSAGQKEKLLPIDATTVSWDKWLGHRPTTTRGAAPRRENYIELDEPDDNEPENQSTHVHSTNRQFHSKHYEFSGQTTLSGNNEFKSWEHIEAEDERMEGPNGTSQILSPDTLTKSLEEEENCSICREKPMNPKVLPKCKHVFCRECIENCFEKMQPKCPNCGEVYGKLQGTQPKNGTMKIAKSVWPSLPGYEKCGTITIHYDFPDGTQTEEHPHPGRTYYGTSRTAYLPDNAEGNRVLSLLRGSFDARMIFTIGRSSTTGRDDCVIWNCIHHKTCKHGGQQNYGYPDPTYLERVTGELAAQGFK